MRPAIVSALAAVLLLAFQVAPSQAAPKRERQIDHFKVVRLLGKVATQIRKSSHQILVIGHTDNKPIGPALVKQYPTNWELAGARAASVVRLFARSGLPGRRLRAVSVADTQPVASNKTEEGRARNRRIEIRLLPLPGTKPATAPPPLRTPGGGETASPAPKPQ